MNSPFIQVTHKTHVNDFSLSTIQGTNCTLTKQKPPACARIFLEKGQQEATCKLAGNCFVVCFTIFHLQSPFIDFTQMDQQTKILLRSCILACLYRVFL